MLRKENTPDNADYLHRACRGCQDTGFIGAESNPGRGFCGCEAGRDRRWEERDAKKEKEREYFAAQRQAAHEAHVQTVMRGLNRVTSNDAGMLRLIAEAAVTALEDDGVVFARMGSFDDDDRDELE